MNTERRMAIKEMLQQKPFISLHELELRFPNVSSMTLRRDIEYFESIGEAIKVRGGARSMKFITTSMEDAFNLRMAENPQAKEKVACRALEEIEPGRSYFFDSGTTMLKLSYLMPDERVSIVTTGPNIAMELAKKSLPIINIVGGMFNRDSISVSGNQAVSFLSNINIDTAFIVPSGLSVSDGLTSGNYTECELKRLIVDKARKVIVLMDNSKLGKTLPYTFCQITDIDMIISDRPLPDEIADAAKKSGIEIIIAE